MTKIEQWEITGGAIVCKQNQVNSKQFIIDVIIIAVIATDQLRCFHYQAFSQIRSKTHFPHSAVKRGMIFFSNNVKEKFQKGEMT